MKISICGADRCYRQDLYDRLATADANLNGANISVEKSPGCLGGCGYAPRVDVDMDNGDKRRYGSRVYVDRKRILIHPIGDDPLATIIEANLTKPKQ